MPSKIKIYLAGKYSSHPKMREYRDILIGLGFEVTSRWIEGTHTIPEDASEKERNLYRASFASIDLHDLGAADLIIAFTENEEGRAKGNNRGGRHVESLHADALG